MDEGEEESDASNDDANQDNSADEGEEESDASDHDADQDESADGSGDEDEDSFDGDDQGSDDSSMDEDDNKDEDAGNGGGRGSDDGNDQGNSDGSRNDYDDGSSCGSGDEDQGSDDGNSDGRSEDSRSNDGASSSGMDNGSSSDVRGDLGPDDNDCDDGEKSDGCTDGGSNDGTEESGDTVSDSGAMDEFVDDASAVDVEVIGSDSCSESDGSDDIIEAEVIDEDGKKRSCGSDDHLEKNYDESIEDDNDSRGSSTQKFHHDARKLSFHSPARKPKFLRKTEVNKKLDHEFKEAVSPATKKKVVYKETPPLGDESSSDSDDGDESYKPALPKRVKRKPNPGIKSGNRLKKSKMARNGGDNGDRLDIAQSVSPGYESDDDFEEKFDFKSFEEADMRKTMFLAQLQYVREKRASEFDFSKHMADQEDRVVNRTRNKTKGKPLAKKKGSPSTRGFAKIGEKSYTLLNKMDKEK